MIPQQTLFNGKGSDHTLNNWLVPFVHFTDIKHPSNSQSHLVLMDISTKTVVYGWYRYNGPYAKVGIRQYGKIMRDGRGRYFVVRGNKIRI